MRQPSTLYAPSTILYIALVTALAVILAILTILVPVLAFGTVAALFLGFIVFKSRRLWQPDFLLYFLVLFLPFQVYLNLGEFPLSTVYILIGMITAVWMLRGLFGKRWTLYLPREIWPMALLMGIIIVNSVAAPVSRSSLILGVQLVAYYVIFLIVATILDDEKKIHTIVNAFLIGTILSSTLGVLQAFVGNFAPQVVVSIFFKPPLAYVFWGSRGLQRLGAFGPEGPLILYRGASIEGTGDIFRTFGMLEGPTIYGWFSVTLAVLAGDLWMTPVRGATDLRTKARSATLLTVLAVFLSWTRSAWLALLISFVFILTFRRARSLSLLSLRWWKFGLVTAAVLSLIIFIGLATSSTALGRIIISSIGGENAAGSNAGRIQTMRFALDYLLHHPLIGAGFGNYAYAASAGQVAANAATATTAHNTYLELGVELGIPGLVAYLWLLFMLLARALQLVKQPLGTYWHALGIAMTGVWLSFMFMLLFGGNIIHPKWMTCWWILAGTQVAAERTIKRQHTTIQ